jgi:lysophospholipase L1-like esterase
MLTFAIEAAGRAVVHFKYGIPGKSYGLWQYDRQLGAIHASNAYNSNSETNNFGSRNREDVAAQKPPGSYRVIAYGGSTTFNYNLATDAAWPIQLQNVLRRHHHGDDQVLNAGAINWALAHEITRAERDLPIVKPDFVIIYSGLNEGKNARATAREGKDIAAAVAPGAPRVLATNYDQTRWVTRNSVIVRYLMYSRLDWFRGTAVDAEEMDEVEMPPPLPNTDVDPIVMKYYSRLLTDFIALIRSHGAKPIYIIVGAANAAGPLAARLQYSRKGAAVARNLDVPVLDAQKVVEDYSGNKRDLFAKSGLHWSAKGATLFAEFIFANAFAREITHQKSGQ